MKSELIVVTLWLCPLIENNDIVCFSLIKNGDICVANEVDLKQLICFIRRQHQTDIQFFWGCEGHNSSRLWL